MAYELNLNQQAAVDAGDEPLLVVAGPGAGKSTVLQRRIERLLSSKEVLASYARVLAVTFTNVAADNLRARLQGSSEIIRERVEIGTFHRFAARLLQQYGSHLGLSPNFEISNGIDDRLAIFSQAVDQLLRERKIPQPPQRALLQLISRLYETVADSASIGDVLDSSVDVDTVSAVFDRYADVSIQLNQLDFSLLVYLADKLLRIRPAIAKQTRSVYRYICVDEFQDTNDTQFRFLSSIAGSDPTGLFLLADQDQVIYQWNGATPLRLQQAKERFQLAVLELPTSYRCPLSIITAANNLISHNETRFLKPHFDSALTETESKINIQQFDTDSDELRWVAQSIHTLRASGNNSCVVLARNRQILTKIIPKMSALGISAEIPVAKYEWSSPPLVMLYAILKLANQPASEKYLAMLLEAFYKITGVSLDESTLVAEAGTEESTSLEAFAHQSSKRAQSTAFKDLMKYVIEQLVMRKSYRFLSSLLFTWVEQLPPASGREAFLIDYDSEKRIWTDIEAAHMGLQSEDLPLSEFLRQVDLSIKSKPMTGAVPLLTVHAAKGLEFDNVFLIAAAERQFPAYQAVIAGAESYAMEEERRSFFVAITRTRKQLTITYAKQYSGYGTAPSRFIAELGVAV